MNSHIKPFTKVWVFTYKYSYIILSWQKEKLHFHFKLEYFNTASSKLILDILSKLEEIDGTSVTWFFHEDDEDMEEAGEEFSDLVEVPFEFSTY